MEAVSFLLTKGLECLELAVFEQDVEDSPKIYSFSRLVPFKLQVHFG